MTQATANRESGNNNKEHEVDRKNESRMFVGVHLHPDVFIHSFVFVYIRRRVFVREGVTSSSSERKKGVHECG